MSPRCDVCGLVHASQSEVHKCRQKSHRYGLTCPDCHAPYSTRAEVAACRERHEATRQVHHERQRDQLTEKVARGQYTVDQVVRRWPELFPQAELERRWPEIYAPAGVED